MNNILIDENGILKLSDFGISTKLQPDKLAQTAVGTPYYLSPEIITSVPYDHKSDIWMLGCTIYELCCNRRPFEGESLQEIFFKVMNEEPLAIPERYSFFLRNIIKRMLDKDPSKRPSILQIFEFLEVKQEVNKLISEYPQVYKDFEPLQFGKKKG